jgi:outer membrane biosynthesis protein TonB
MRVSRLVPIGIALLSSLTPVAFADDVDELATPQWNGFKNWAPKAASSPAPAPAPTGPAAPATSGGTATSGDGSTVPPPEGGTVTPDDEPVEPSEPDPTPEPEPDPTAQPSPPPEPAPIIMAVAPLPSCSARWTLTESCPTAESQAGNTLLTAYILETDPYAYVANLWTRANSTLYIDWFADNWVKKESERKTYVAVIELKGACGNCAPSISFNGTAHLDAQALLKSWGPSFGVYAGTYGFAKGYSQFQLPKAITAQGGVRLIAGSGTPLASAEVGGVRVNITGGGTRHYDAAIESQPDNFVQVGGVMVVEAATFGRTEACAAGDLSHAEAKINAGHEETVQGTTNCGATCVFKMVRKTSK